MPYGNTYDLEDIEERREQRKKERDENYKSILSSIRKGEEDVVNFAFGVMFLMLVVAAVMYWFLSPLAALFVAIIAAVVHLHWMIRWLYQNVRVAQLNTIQNQLLATELYDDMQELIAKQNKRKAE